jgi:hypothetical protein
MDGLLEQLLTRATTPLTQAPAQSGTAAMQQLTQPQLNQSPTMARLKGFAGGAAEGAGKLASDMTSPLSLAMMLIPGGLDAMAGKSGASVLGTIGKDALLNAGGNAIMPPEFAPVGVRLR